MCRTTAVGHIFDEYCSLDLHVCHGYDRDGGRIVLPTLQGCFANRALW